MTVHGLRVATGPRPSAGGRRVWKAWMESHAFFDAFGHVPGRSPGRSIESWPGTQRPRPGRRRRAPSAGLSPVRGPVSRRPPISSSSAMSIARSMTPKPNPRLIVLGGWQRRSSFLKIDENGATFHVEHDREHESPTRRQPRQPSLTHDRGDLDEDLIIICTPPTLARQSNRSLALDRSVPARSAWTAW